MDLATLRLTHPIFPKALWPVAWAATLFFLSGRAGAGPEIPGFDKVAHFAAYGLLATLVCRVGWGRGEQDSAPTPLNPILGALLASLYGATDEWHQSFVPGRSPEVADWVADTAGAVLAVVLYVRWAAYRRLLELRIRKSKQRVVEKPEGDAPQFCP